jgi:hypothetical protein
MWKCYNKTHEYTSINYTISLTFSDKLVICISASLTKMGTTMILDFNNCHLSAYHYSNFYIVSSIMSIVEINKIDNKFDSVFICKIESKFYL